MTSFHHTETVKTWGASTFDLHHDFPVQYRQDADKMIHIEGDLSPHPARPGEFAKADIHASARTLVEALENFKKAHDEYNKNNKVNAV